MSKCISKFCPDPQIRDGWCLHHYGLYGGGWPSPDEYVREFHVAFKLPIREKPAVYGKNSPDVHLEDQKLRKKLLIEEYTEYLDAVEEQDLVEIADALADMVYVIYGTALTYGIDLDAVLAEVHRSNMTKLEDGKPVYHPNGKVAKGKDFQPPNIRKVLGLDG